MTNKIKVTQEKRTIELEGNIIHSKKGHSALLSNAEYGIYFSDALEEIAVNKALSKADIKLMILLISHLAKKEYKIKDNRIRLMRGKDYGDLIGVDRGNVVRAFQKLEECGYIKRFKENKSVEVTINPAVAMREKVSEVDSVWNQLAVPFGNDQIKIQQAKDEEGQDWKSDLPRQLEQRNKGSKR